MGVHWINQKSGQVNRTLCVSQTFIQSTLMNACIKRCLTWYRIGAIMLYIQYTYIRFKPIHWLLSDPQINVYARTSSLLCHLGNCAKQQKIQFFFLLPIFIVFFYVRHFIIVLLPVCYNNIIQKVAVVNNAQKSNFPSCLIRNVVFGF